MTDYTEFDALLIKAIKCGATTASALSGKLNAQANAIIGKDRYGDPLGWRLIDRRLQALRKKSTLAYDRKAGWTVVERS